jgi:hypothetical protein
MTDRVGVWIGWTDGWTDGWTKERRLVYQVQDSRPAHSVK